MTQTANRHHSTSKAIDMQLSRIEKLCEEVRTSLATNVYASNDRPPNVEARVADKPKVDTNRRAPVELDHSDAELLTYEPTTRAATSTITVTPTSKPAPAHSSTTARRFEPLKSAALPEKRFEPKNELPEMPTPTIVRKVLKDCHEHWDRLAHGLSHMVHEQGLRTVLVCDSLPREGSTTVTQCLATSLTKTDLRVLVIDGDLARPGLANLLGIKPGVGLEHLLLEDCPADEAMWQSPHHRVTYLPVGQKVANPATVLDPQRCMELLTAFCNYYDLVVIDGGSAFAGGNSALWTTGIDAAILVHDPNASNQALLEQLDSYLESRNISCLGVIENFVE